MTIQANFPALKPALLLDFQNTKQLDPRITYTRASTATFYNGVTTAMAEQNLLLQSQTFNTSWNASNCTITLNSTTAPDGTTTASTLTALAGTASLYPNTAIPILANTNYTVSFYVKQGTGGWLLFNLWTGSTNNGVSQWVNMSTGALGTSSATAGFSVTSSAVSSVGSGWYRVSLVGQSTSATNIYPNIRHVDGDNSFAFTTTTGLYSYIWGAQLEQRSAVSAYTVTTTQAITNYIPVLQTAASGVARFDNNPTTSESLGLLIEESRTNLVTYSDQFDNAAWTTSGSLRTANTIVAPDGTLTGDKLIGVASAGVAPSVFQSVTVSTSTVYTWSVYAKAGEYSYLMLKAQDTVSGTNPTWFNLSNGTIGTNSTGNTSTITSVGNGWYRCTISRTTSSTSAFMNIQTVSADNISTLTGNGFSGMFIWGAQLEAGAFATSYIPTVASQVTRAADAASMTGTNFSSWFNNGEFTLYAEAENRNGITSSTNYHLATISDGTNANAQLIRIDGADNRPSTYGSNGSAANQWLLYGTAVSKGTFSKLALGYALNNVGFSANAGTVGTDAVAQIPLQNLLTIGAGATNAQLTNGCIKKIAYYPFKATSTQLQALTS